MEGTTGNRWSAHEVGDLNIIFCLQSWPDLRRVMLRIVRFLKKMRAGNEKLQTHTHEWKQGKTLACWQKESNQ